MAVVNVKNSAVKMMTRAAVFAALICVCAWLSLPVGDISVTMQTFAVFLTLFLLGGKWGTVTVLLYLSLGAVGLPVFSAFQGGFAVLLGPSGGFLWGFLGMALIFWGLERFGQVLPLIFGLIFCYGCGCFWFSHICGGGFYFALARCVVPFLLPDSIKLYLVHRLSRRLRPHL